VKAGFLFVKFFSIVFADLGKQIAKIDFKPV